MPEYRFYIIEKDGRIAMRPTAIEFPNDNTALDAANKSKHLLEGLSVEIWQRSRIVARLNQD
jgi:hypothetical protein